MLIWRMLTFYFGLLISILIVAFAKDTKGGIMKGIKEMEKAQDEELSSQAGPSVIKPEDIPSDGDSK